MIDNNRLVKTLEAQSWTYAKTMPQWPHHYIVRKEVDLDFTELVEALLLYSVPAQWNGRARNYFYANGFHYWIMGAPAFETTIINRAPADYMARLGWKDDYKDTAAKYDSRYLSAEDISEEDAIFDTLQPFGKVLDIGCGTALFADIVKRRGEDPTVLQSYVGFDPSRGMLNEGVRKHPELKDQLRSCILGDWYESGYDTIIGLFGVGSYIQEYELPHLQSMLNEGGQLFLMSYLPDYVPSLYLEEGIQKPDFEPWQIGAGEMFGRYGIYRDSK